MPLRNLSDEELVNEVHKQDSLTPFETEFMTRMIESGQEDMEITVDLEDEIPKHKMISVDNAMLVCAVFLMIQAAFLLYVLPCN